MSWLFSTNWDSTLFPTAWQALAIVKLWAGREENTLRAPLIWILFKLTVRHGCRIRPYYSPNRLFLLPIPRPSTDLCKILGFFSLSLKQKAVHVFKMQNYLEQWAEVIWTGKYFLSSLQSSISVSISGFPSAIDTVMSDRHRVLDPAACKPRCLLASTWPPASQNFTDTSHIPGHCQIRLKQTMSS